MSDTTSAELIQALQQGRWAPSPGHVEPKTIAGGDDPVAQMLAALPAEIPTTPLPDAVANGEAAGDLTPGGPDWGAAPPDELAIAQTGSAPVSAPQPAPGAVPPPPAPAAPETAQQSVTAATVINVPPAELAVGDIVQFAAGPLGLTAQNGDLWVMSDCTLRYFHHLPAIPVIRP